MKVHITKVLESFTTWIQFLDLIDKVIPVWICNGSSRYYLQDLSLIEVHVLYGIMDLLSIIDTSSSCQKVNILKESREKSRDFPIKLGSILGFTKGYLLRGVISHETNGRWYQVYNGSPCWMMWIPRLHRRCKYEAKERVLEDQEEEEAKGRDHRWAVDCSKAGRS